MSPHLYSINYTYRRVTFLRAKVMGNEEIYEILRKCSNSHLSARTTLTAHPSADAESYLGVLGESAWWLGGLARGVEASGLRISPLRTLLVVAKGFHGWEVMALWALRTCSFAWEK